MLTWLAADLIRQAQATGLLVGRQTAIREHVGKNEHVVIGPEARQDILEHSDGSVDVVLFDEQSGASATIMLTEAERTSGRWIGSISTPLPICPYCAVNAMRPGAFYEYDRMAAGIGLGL